LHCSSYIRQVIENGKYGSKQTQEYEAAYCEMQSWVPVVKKSFTVVCSTKRVRNIPVDVVSAAEVVDSYRVVDAEWPLHWKPRLSVGGYVLWLTSAQAPLGNNGGVIVNDICR